jgi:hypothetical protein
MVPVPTLAVGGGRKDLSKIKAGIVAVDFDLPSPTPGDLSECGLPYYNFKGLSSQVYRIEIPLPVGVTDRHTFKFKRGQNSKGLAWLGAAVSKKPYISEDNI